MNEIIRILKRELRIKERELTFFCEIWSGIIFIDSLLNLVGRPTLKLQYKSTITVSFLSFLFHCLLLEVLSFLSHLTTAMTLFALAAVKVTALFD